MHRKVIGLVNYYRGLTAQEHNQFLGQSLAGQRIMVGNKPKFADHPEVAVGFATTNYKHGRVLELAINPSDLVSVGPYWRLKESTLVLIVRDVIVAQPKYPVCQRYGEAIITDWLAQYMVRHYR